jgi:hypothetical protein
MREKEERERETRELKASLMDGADLQGSALDLGSASIEPLNGEVGKEVSNNQRRESAKAHTAVDVEKEGGQSGAERPLVLASALDDDDEDDDDEPAGGISAAVAAFVKIPSMRVRSLMHMESSSSIGSLPLVELPRIDSSTELDTLDTTAAATAAAVAAVEETPIIAVRPVESVEGRKQDSFQSGEVVQDRRVAEVILSPLMSAMQSFDRTDLPPAGTTAVTLNTVNIGRPVSDSTADALEPIASQPMAPASSPPHKDDSSVFTFTTKHYTNLRDDDDNELAPQMIVEADGDEIVEVRTLLIDLVDKVIQRVSSELSHPQKKKGLSSKQRRVFEDMTDELSEYSESHPHSRGRHDDLFSDTLSEGDSFVTPKSPRPPDRMGARPASMGALGKCASTAYRN